MQFSAINSQSNPSVQPANPVGSTLASGGNGERKDFSKFVAIAGESQDQLDPQNLMPTDINDEQLDHAEEALSKTQQELEAEAPGLYGVSEVDEAAQEQLKRNDKASLSIAGSGDSFSIPIQKGEKQSLVANQKVENFAQPEYKDELALVGDPNEPRNRAGKDKVTQGAITDTGTINADMLQKHRQHIKTRDEPASKGRASHAVNSENTPNGLMSAKEALASEEFAKDTASRLSGLDPKLLKVEHAQKTNSGIARSEGFGLRIGIAEENAVSASGNRIIEAGKLTSNETTLRVETSAAQNRSVELPPGLDVSQRENSLTVRNVLETPLSRAETVVGATASVTVEASAHRPEIVRNAASQAVEVFVRQPNRTVEVSLRPEELGRVRLALTTSETGVVISVTSERPETLDLMRRHIDQLAQEFARLGYQEMDFQFGEEASGEEGKSTTTESKTAAQPAEHGEPETAQHTLLVSTGLDVRM